VSDDDLQRKADAAHAEWVAAEERRERGWQPAETAPLHTPVLVWASEGYDNPVEWGPPEALIAEQSKYPDGSPVWRIWPEPDEWIDLRVTHWMPRPDGPRN
jgi:hypothetical protein